MYEINSKIVCKRLSKLIHQFNNDTYKVNHCQLQRNDIDKFLNFICNCKDWTVSDRIKFLVCKCIFKSKINSVKYQKYVSST